MHDEPTHPRDRAVLRREVQAKYAEVALTPTRTFHFHTGRTVAERCRYDMDAVDALPAFAVESFAGVANPFELRDLEPGLNRRWPAVRRLEGAPGVDRLRGCPDRRTGRHVRWRGR